LQLDAHGWRYGRDLQKATKETKKELDGGRQKDVKARKIGDGYSTAKISEVEKGRTDNETKKLCPRSDRVSWGICLLRPGELGQVFRT
jgi:hypothetical protein